MRDSSTQPWERAARLLEQPGIDLTAAVGFDGFVDAIYQIDGPSEGEPPVARFRTVAEFGRYLIDSPGQNSSFALRRTATRIGGNMPIMSNSLGCLGIRVSSVGMVGYPAPAPIFDQMSAMCELVGFADPAQTTAFEFADGKLLFAESDELDRIDWATVVERVGLERLRELFVGRPLIGLVNWSELRNATVMWRGLLEDVLLDTGAPWRPTIVVDLADCSRKTTAQTTELLDVLRRYAELGTVVLVLNEGEARHVHERTGGTAGSDLVAICSELYRSLELQQVVVRNAWEAIACGAEGWARVPTFHTDEPVVRTGAGDTFNAGYAFAHLLGESLDIALVTGVAVAGYYVRTGVSPSREDLARFLREEGTRTAAHEHRVATW